MEQFSWGNNGIQIRMEIEVEEKYPKGFFKLKNRSMRKCAILRWGLKLEGAGRILVPYKVKVFVFNL